MKLFSTYLFITLLVGSIFTQAADAQTNENNDLERIEKAATNYLEAFCLGQPDKIRESVSEDVFKVGVAGPDEESLREFTMDFQAMIDYANRIAESGEAMEYYPDSTMILDVGAYTAVVRVEAWWGRDFLSMIKKDGHWKIRTVIWDGPRGLYID